MPLRSKQTFFILLFLFLTFMTPGEALSAADSSTTSIGGTARHSGEDRGAVFSDMKDSLAGHCLFSYDPQRTNECSVSSHIRRLNTKNLLKGLPGVTGDCRFGYRTVAIYLLQQAGNSREKLPQGARSPPFSDLRLKLFLAET